MTANDKNGTLYSNSYISSDNGNSNGFTNYLDRLVLQAMAEITLKSNVPYVDRLPDSIGKGLYELVGGYGLLRYLAKNYSDGMPDGVSYNKAKTVLTLSTDFTDSTLDLANLASTVKTVNASALKSGVKILGNSSANLIDGGAGADTLNGGTGNDTLTGGAGKDVFVYSGGKDVISGFESGDLLQITDAFTASYNSSKKSVVFKVGSGSVTLRDFGSTTTFHVNDTTYKLSGGSLTEK